MKTLKSILLAALSLMLILSAVTGAAEGTTKITVGATPVPHAEILTAAIPLLAEQGIELIVQEFTDYVLPNLALESGDIDANYFQHLPYLNDFNANNDTHLVPLTLVHYEPFGVYPGKTKTIEDLKDGAEIAIPNDTTNEARALQLLAAQGLLTLPEGAGLDVTVLDIIDNPKNLVFIELEAAQIPRALPDFDLAVINGNYALDAGLNVATDSVAREASDSLAAETFGNYLVVKEGSEENEALLALAEVLNGEVIRKFIDDTYSGSVVPKG
ncbi:lipoprotein [Clostridia bacterium]|nr:lipoprotein [Clostridia bacterium]